MRHETLTQLRRHLNAVILKSPGQAIGVYGEAGVGKTFTLQTLLSEIPCKHLAVHSGMPIAEMAKALPRSPGLPAWAKTQLEQLQRGQSLNAQALEDTLAVTLSGLAPFVVLFEDLHEANPERLELIQKLARVAPRLRGVALLASSRAELPAPFRCYRLEALDHVASDALLETQAQGPLPKAGLDWVFTRAQGNALFTLEFWRYLVRQGAFWSDGQRWQWRKPSDDFVPVSIEALILELLNHQMDRSTQAVLEAKALLEQPELTVSNDTWAAVAEVSREQLLTSQTYLQARGLLEDTRFAHPLFREVLTREMPAERWRTYGQRALRVLEVEYPEQAALLFDRLGVTGEAALRLLKAAQNSAERRGDKIAVAKWLARSVEFLDEPERSQKALEAARGMRGFDLIGAEKLISLVASGEHPMPEAGLLYAQILNAQGQGQQAEVILERIECPENLAVQRFQTFLVAKVVQGKGEEAIRLWETHPEMHELVDRETRSDIGFSYVNQGKIEQAERLVRDMLELQPSEPEAVGSIWHLQAIIHTAQGRHAEALKAFNTVIQISQQLQSPGKIAINLKNYSVIARHLGLLEEARQKLQAALDICNQNGLTRIYSTVQDILSSILADEGRFEEAENLLKQSEIDFAVTENLRWRCTNHIAQAKLYLEWRPTSGIPLALRHARAGLRLARESGSVYLLARSLEFTARAEALNRNPATAMQLALELQALVEKAPTERVRHFCALGFALEAVWRNDEARAAHMEAYAIFMQEHNQVEAERAALEADRISGDLHSAQQRYAWFHERGLFGGAKLALRYFPAIAVAEAASSSAADNPEVSLRLNVLGMPQLERDGQTLVYRGKKRLELLCYLLEARIAGRSEVSAMELSEVFYPDTSDREAKHTLRQQVYLIRADFGQQCVHSTTNGYALAAATSDAEQFLETGDTRLWRGAYLERVSEGWDGNVRDCLVQSLRTSFERLLETDPAEASRVSQMLIDMEPYDAEILRLALLAHRKNGDHKSTLRVYKEAQERFWGVSETLPPTAEDFLRMALASQRG